MVEDWLFPATEARNLAKSSPWKLALLLLRSAVAFKWLLTLKTCRMIYLEIGLNGHWHDAPNRAAIRRFICRSTLRGRERQFFHPANAYLCPILPFAVLENQWQVSDCCCRSGQVLNANCWLA